MRKNISSQKLTLAVLFVLVLTQVNCTRWKDPYWCHEKISFQTLEMKSNEYDGKKVCMNGTVRNPLNLDLLWQALNATPYFDNLSAFKLYWLENGVKKRVLVLTESNAPREGNRLTINAQVYQAFSYMNLSYTLLIERNRKIQ